MSDSASSRLVRPLIATGAVAAGTYAGLSAARWWHRRTLSPPNMISPALDWDSRTLETDDGRSHCYVRPGSGPPMVFLHSFNAVGSSFEMKPIAEHYAATTTRPLYAVDWLGFGRSDRPDCTYTPSLYADQLYQVLTDLVDAPADLVGLSLGCEYAAWMGLQAAPQVRRLALISPTGLTSPRGPSAMSRLALALAGPTGLFDFAFYQLTRRSSLRSYYERQVFLHAEDVPDDLLDYAETTAHAQGAPHAPRHFVEGRLSLHNVAGDVYSRLYRPTLFLTPSTPGPTVQSFDLLPTLLDQNTHHLSHKTTPGGLMPQWDTPTPLFEALDAFLLPETNR